MCPSWFRIKLKWIFNCKKKIRPSAMYKQMKLWQHHFSENSLSRNMDRVSHKIYTGQVLLMLLLNLVADIIPQERVDEMQ